MKPVPLRRALTRPAGLLASLLLASCVPSPTPAPHYVLGEPYQAGGVWWYPRSDLRLDARGLAEVYGDHHPPLTTDGEAFDQTAMAAANQTLPLPAIALVTNLETGRQLKLRINDRGPATPQRMLAVTRRVAQLLGFPPSGVAQVRLEVLEGDSQAAQNALPGAPKLAITAAPRGAVAAASLAPPPGARASSGGASFGGASAGATEAAAPGNPDTTMNAPPAQAADAAMRLPETVTQVTPDPGALWIELGSFPAYEFANMQRAAVAQLGATIVSEPHANSEMFRVTIGPIQDVAQADRLVDEAVASGISDAHVVVR
jgi:rare lipoprotein A